MTHMLMGLANGKVSVCLEVSLTHSPFGLRSWVLFLTYHVQGGYNFRSISKSALAVTKTLMGEPPDRLLVTSPSEVAVGTVRRVIMAQSRHWQCMYPKEPKEVGLWTDRLHGRFTSFHFFFFFPSLWVIY